MAKIVAKTFALNMSSQDLGSLLSYQIVHSGSKQLTLDGGGGFTAVFQGKDFVDNDADGLPDTGTIKKIQISFNGQPVFTLSGINMSVATFRDFVDANDPLGLQQALLSGKDQIVGSDQDDWLAGYDGNDIMEGGLGADTLGGGAGDDQLIGGAGKDQLKGSDGLDTFKFKAIGDSTADAATADVITDIEDGDVIDLRAIDADEAKSGNNSFELVNKFTGEAGQATLKYQAGQERTLLMLDTDGDSQADMVIVLLGGDHRDHADFVL